MCNICSSELLGEINKKRNWRPDRVVKWAGKRGLNISERDLSDHFDQHAKPTVKVDCKKKPKKKSQSKAIKKQPVASSANDTKLLDEVVNRVYENLTTDEFDLKLEHGFKAIEIKQKIADKSDSENLLLELLNEIRQQELA